VGRLDQKTALVTGGASGIGKAIARRLASEGARVVITDLQTPLGKQAAVEGGFDFLEHDVTDEDRWSDVIHDVEERHGGLHVLVNNAGIVGPIGQNSPENTPLATWKMIFSVNVEGVFLGCRAGIAAMRRSGGGSIVNISSVAGLLATPYNTAYGASKAAVRQLTKSVAQHCADEGLNVRCNSVHPGDVHTPLWDGIAKQTAERSGLSVAEVLAQEAQNSPMGGFTLVEDIAAAVAFLASEDARRITGTMLIVDGGLIDCDTYHLVKSKKGYAETRKRQRP
jgi:NAD(P)-dependent dehydrogenase (short-subunit alcohol dehydrogenase family)